MIGGVVLGRPSPATLDRRLERARAGEVTYDRVGSTWADAGADRPGLHIEHRDAGRGRAAFDRVAGGLRTWVAQRSIGGTVVPDGAPVEEGTTIVTALPVGPVTALAPCRVVRVVEEADRFGFAYGSLPGHPFKGEERFSVALLPDDRVRITIAVEAVGANPVIRLGSPLARLSQRKAIRGYLDGLAALV